MCETACPGKDKYASVWLRFMDSRSLTLRAGGALGGPLQLPAASLVHTFMVPAFTGLLVLRTAWREIRRQGHADLT